MNITIYFKDSKVWRHYKMEEDEFKKLQDDYLQYTKSGLPQGGAYTMVTDEQYADTTPRTVLLKFDEINFA